MCKKDCGKGCCVSMVAKVLLIIGGINLGLVGVGMLMDNNLNVINLLLDGMPKLEAMVYVFVGVAAVMIIFGCKCSKCKAVCSSCAPDISAEKMAEKM